MQIEPNNLIAKAVCGNSYTVFLNCNLYDKIVNSNVLYFGEIGNSDNRILKE